ncbi:hypothetical protein [Agarivorans sp. 1_MG-2023]|uniref:hypothetical protein n=1 Tax=Agarivorans sp. 1_MG-2023 TaxID=3062634 RepID=UPI0026E39D07|nr:hypothetical protein [Agarivorans sp. 1_MG-2023]MDO6763094.1 hypothetical protein [Agarivorans sp. 1_MG-2023]
MVDKPTTDSAPSDDEIDAIYQQATENIQPSELLDKRIQAMAKKQAETLKPKAKSYSWASAPWWASAASFACVGVLGWWLVSETSVPPSEIQYQSHVSLLQAPKLEARSESDEALSDSKRKQHEFMVAEARKREEKARQQQAKPSTKTAKRQAAEVPEQVMIIRERALFDAASTQMPASAVTAKATEQQRSCIENILQGVEAEQLKPLLASDLAKLTDLVKPQDLQEIRWQGRTWQIFEYDLAWLVTQQSPDGNFKEGYRIPGGLTRDCQP